MYICYAPKLSYMPNIIFISLTLGLLQIMTLVSIHPRVSQRARSSRAMHPRFYGSRLIFPTPS